MAAIEQSRSVDPSATQASTLAQESASSAGAALSIRLWRAQEKAQAGDLSWQGTDPAVCLTLDGIAAGQGGQTGQAGQTGRAGQGAAPTPDGRFLVAAFAGIQPAILTARRLQWALQGFSEDERFSGTAAAILVHCGEDLPALAADVTVLLPLEKAAPGTILLTAKTAELLRDLPGLPVQAAPETGPSELLWRSPGDAPSRIADEEVVSQFIKLHGLEVEAPAPSPEPVAADTPPAHGGTDRGVRELPDTAGPDAMEPEQPAPGSWIEGLRANPRLLIGGACAAAILLVIVVVAVFHKGEGKQAPGTAQTAVSTTATPSGAGPQIQAQAANPAAGTGAAAASTVPVKPGETARRGKHEEAVQGDQPASDSAKAQANQAKAVGGNCELDSNLLPKMLDQAERSREEGHYPAALRQFRAVLACDPRNARARSGLELTQFGMQHQ